MIIALIGMSNSGKSYWSKRLKKIGFIKFSCDDIIERKLKKEIKKFGFKGIGGVAEWMGQPYEAKYEKNSRKYLEFEKETLEEIIQKIKKKHFENRNIVIDTTGSLIYLDQKIKEELKKLARIVYLNTPRAVQKQMLANYIEKPKPVIWGSLFTKKKGQSNREALAECYPKLLKFRTREYEKYADLTIDYFLRRSEDFNVKKLVALVPL